MQKLETVTPETPVNPAGVNRWTSALQNTGSVISICTAFAILASVVYNWAYFDTIGLFPGGLITLPDVIRSAISWLPPATASIGLGLLLAFVNQAPKGPRYERNVRRADRFFVAVLSIVIVATYFNSPADNYGFLLLIAMLWVTALNLSNSPWGPIRRLLVTLLPPLLLAAYSVGNLRALSDLKETQFRTVLSMVDHSPAQSVALFRFFETGVLYRRSPDSRIEFIRWEQVAELSSDNLQPALKPRMCSMFGWACHFPTGAIQNAPEKTP